MERNGVRVRRGPLSSRAVGDWDMDVGQALRVAFSSLLANKLRSSLTMLGMMIGVGAVITLMSIGQGAQAAVQEQFNSLGVNLVFVEPGTSNAGGIKTL